MLGLSLLSLAAVAVASPISTLHQYARALEGRAVTVTAQDLSNFKFYIQHASASYCNVDSSAGDAITCSGGCPDVEADKATVVGSFAGDATGISGYVSTDLARKEIVVSIRGSSNVRNWIANLVFIQTDCDLVAGCGVHTGFMSAWKEIADSVKAAVSSAKKTYPDFKVVTAGHSLGGAVATLAAAYLRKDGYPADVYSYGSPRVGDDDFANFVTQQAGAEYRVTHVDDPVPRLPPIFTGYRHTSPEYWLSNGDASTLDYGIEDIVVCEGIANVKCNGGTLGLDTEAHGNYFQDVGMCSPGDGINWRRDDVSDEELEQRLNEYALKDKEFVENMDA